MAIRMLNLVTESEHFLCISAYLGRLIKSEAAVDLRTDGPERNLPVGRCLADEHVVQGEVVAYGILEKKRKKTHKKQAKLVTRCDTTCLPSCRASSLVTFHPGLATSR